MGDFILVLMAVGVLLFGGMWIVFTIRRERRRLLAARRHRTGQLKQTLRTTDQLIKNINEAETDEDLDRLSPEE